MYMCEGFGCNKQYPTKIGRGVHHTKCKFYQKEEVDSTAFKFVCECGKKFEKMTQLKGHGTKCGTRIDIVHSYKKMITFEILDDLYVKKKMSALQIAKTLNYPHIGAGAIIQILKDFGFTTRSIKAAANNETTRNLYKQTCIEKYGGDNALCKNSPLYEKRNNTVLERYGVTNVFAAPGIKAIIKDTLIARYGVDNPIKMPGRKFNDGKKSKVHIKVENLLDELNITYTSEDTRNLFEKNGYSPRPDIIIDNLKIVIEINGDYWHGNPSKYKASDIICKWGGDVLVKDVWDHDKKRKEQIESFGYHVIVLWESFINKQLTAGELWNLLKSRQLKD
jgi:G:T-mismatch repair DNA endonuclease (very short patch repair protein)